MADSDSTPTDLTDETEVDQPAADESPAAVAPGSAELSEDEDAELPAEEPAEEPEPELPRFAAPFSSPEPTAVVARPRRRATRPSFAADAVDADGSAPAAAPAPAFISFVAPSETDVPPAPRRRGRRPAETVDDADETAEAEAAPVEDRDELIAAIASLDLAYEEGSVTQQDWESRRRDLKLRLVESEKP